MKESEPRYHVCSSCGQPSGGLEGCKCTVCGDPVGSDTISASEANLLLGRLANTADATPTVSNQPSEEISAEEFSYLNNPDIS